MSESTSSHPRDKVDAFVGQLHALQRAARPGPGRTGSGAARGALAEMRRAAAEPEARFRLLRFVGDWAPEEPWALDRFLLLAELFATYTAGGKLLPDAVNLNRRRSLGASARSINRRLRKGEQYEDEKPGIGRRFAALLERPYDDLPDELRRFLRLLRQHDAPVDFYELLRHLLAWDHPERPIQLRWARDYWTPPTSNAKTDEN